MLRNAFSKITQSLVTKERRTEGRQARIFTYSSLILCDSNSSLTNFPPSILTFQPFTECPRPSFIPAVYKSYTPVLYP